MILDSMLHGSKILKGEALGCEGATTCFFMDSLLLEFHELLLWRQEMEICYNMIKCSASGSLALCPKIRSSHVKKK